MTPTGYLVVAGVLIVLVLVFNLLTPRPSPPSLRG